MESEPIPERALLLVKPHLLDKEKDICYELSKHGLKILQQKRVRLTEEQAVDFFQDHMQEHWFKDLIAHTISGDALVLHVQRPNVIETLYNVVGPTALDEARKELPESLVAKHGVDQVKNGFYYNRHLIASSREIQFFFPESTLDPFPTSEYTKMFLEDAVYPTLLKGLTALCKEKPQNPTEWLGKWLVENNPSRPIYELP
ncbi:nucleoside diphosphate kinase [Gorgonomyces haynaldii]|nr:nucleoside diphosphate kinase [Gorgonomyces haynaldii]